MLLSVLLFALQYFFLNQVSQSPCPLTLLYSLCTEISVSLSQVTESYMETSNCFFVKKGSILSHKLVATLVQVGLAASFSSLFTPSPSINLLHSERQNVNLEWKILHNCDMTGKSPSTFFIGWRLRPVFSGRSSVFLQVHCERGAAVSARADWLQKVSKGKPCCLQGGRLYTAECICVKVIFESERWVHLPEGVQCLRKQGNYFNGNKRYFCQISQNKE